MRETRQVTVTLLPVAVEFEARPGDRLMILGDICIGVDTSNRKTQQPKLLAPPTEGLTLNASFKVGKSRQPTPRPPANKLRDLILEKIKEVGEIRSADMTSLLGLSQEHRMAVTTRIGELITEKKIRVVSGDRAKRMLALGVS